MLRVLSGVTVFGLLLASACGEPAPRMHVVRARVHAGDAVVVHLESAPRERGALWLTLVPASAPESFVGERIVVEGGATRVTVAAASAGTFEVRLHDDFPLRAHHVVARARIEVAPAAVARRDPPVWFW